MGTVFEQTTEGQYQIHDRADKKSIVPNGNQDPWIVWQNNGFPPSSSPPPTRDDCHGGFRACERKREKRVEGERVASESDHREGSVEIQRRERETIFLSLSHVLRRFRASFPKRTVKSWIS